VISKWSLREVYFDEDGEPLAHRSPPEQEPVFTYEQVKAHIQVAMMSTTPPQRTWVGLTDEEKGFCAAPTYVETVARIEAKLKEKNT
jgi:hypothetical protein